VRLLIAHNRYLQESGEEVAVASEVAMLRDAGCEVELLDVSNRRVAELPHWRVGLGTIWSRAAARRVGERLDAGRFDLLHVHNWFPLLSPAIHWSAIRRGIPVVQTLHNYRLLCPSSSLFREGRICRDCLHRPFPWPGVLHACYRDSRAATLTIATSLAAHRALGTWRRVSLLVAVSEHSRRLLIEGGLPAERVVVKPNFVHPDRGPGGKREEFALFAGRLAPEKGVELLLSAWRGVDLPLKIVGTGDLAARVQEEAARSPRIEYLGRQPREEVIELMGRASLAVVPSLHDENCPLVVLEAFSRGTPVLGRLGGSIGELVRDGENGLLFSGSEHDLVVKLRSIAGRPEELRRLGEGARQSYEARFTRARNLEMLLDIYRRAKVRGSASGAAGPEVDPESTAETLLGQPVE
jgi:glycosyltransferase involved in cell wall biosynthesis